MLLDQMFELEGIELDQLSIKFLSDGLGTQTGDKFDYIKFRKAIKALKAMNMDHHTAVQSTLATAQTMSVNALDINKSAQKFLELIDSEEHKFNVALQRQSVQKIEEKKIALDESIKKIEESKKRLVELNELILSEEKRQIELRESIERNQSLLLEKNQLFHNSIEKIKNLVKEDLNSLK
ncbi:MAG: DUF2470 domain-containing protein [Saprospiraceae bacterium]|nr:DUF2470 domain-containing protein [Saprospiraceae bacterium]